MKTPRLSQIMILSGLLCGSALGPALGSEEDYPAPHRISIWAHAGNGFGEVGATLEVKNAGRDLKSIELSVRGRKFSVPQAQLKTLLHPRLDTVRIATMGSRDGGSPWLCVVFNVAPKDKRLGARGSRAYIKFRDGKLQGIDIWPQKTGG